MSLAVKNVSIIIKTICSLRNWLRKTLDDYLQIRNKNSNDFGRNKTRLAKLKNFLSNNYSTSAGTLRGIYAKQFMTTEAAP